MISLFVYGDTYPMRQILKSNGFWWDDNFKAWRKTATEARLQWTVDNIRQSKRNGEDIYIILREVDIHGSPTSTKQMKIDLRERGEGGILERFREECSGHIITNDYETSRPPRKSLERKKKELEGFY